MTDSLGPKALAVGLVAFAIYRVLWEVADGDRRVDRIAANVEGRL